MNRGFLAFFLLLAAIDPPRERERWVGLSVDEFTIIGNASEREVRDIAAGLLRMRDALSLVTRLKVRSPLPTKVFVFRDESSFAPYRDAATGRASEHLGGVFLPRRDGNYIVMYTGNQSDAWRHVVNHELMHHFVGNTLKGLPTWLNEGLAEVYSTFESDGATVRIGRPRDDHLAILNRDGLMPLHELFAVDEKSPIYNEANRRTMFYAESWALTHDLLIGNPERRAQVGAFLARLAAHQRADVAFRDSFGATEEVEKELRAYVRRLTMPMLRYTMADLKSAEPPPATPLARDELLAHLGDLLAHCGNDTLRDGETMLTAALKLNNANGGASSSLAYIYAVEGKRNDADALYARAVQFNVHEWLPYAMVADTLLDGSSSDDDLVKARALFAKAIELNPDAAHAYAGLGATYVNATSNDVAPGIAALEKSIQLDSEQYDVMFNLVALYVRAGRRADAMRMIDGPLAASRRDQLRARDLVLANDAQHASERLQQTRAPEALEELKKIAAQTNSGELREQIELLVSTVESDQVRQQQVRDYNRAVLLAQNRKYAEALEIADELLPKIEDADFAARVREFRTHVAGALKKR
jgi:Flp pilus assembly protein TadD